MAPRPKRGVLGATALLGISLDWACVEGPPALPAQPRC